jgi:hypothetical protein
MPAESDAQQRFMAGCKHNPQHMEGKCPSAEVAEEFSHKPDHAIPEKKEDVKKSVGFPKIKPWWDNEAK